jgi:putative selenium metabolism hydrolase
LLNCGFYILAQICERIIFMIIDFAKILTLAHSYKPGMTKFLRDMLAIPGESCQERLVIERIKREMNELQFDEVRIDPQGNILGFIGSGPRLLAFDAHIDTVKVGDTSLWSYDPYRGFEDEEIIIGRGASDQLGGMAAMVYAGRIIKDMGLANDFTLLFTGTVQEEDCDGLCWRYIIENDKLRPEGVVLTEPTDGRIYRGHRGRMEIKITTNGISCHGSAPERGINAIYKMMDVISDLKGLSTQLISDSFLGQGSLTVSEIFSDAPSRCAVADTCWISIDRRLTNGESEAYALNQIRNLPAVRKTGAIVEVYSYNKPSYTGLEYSAPCYFPTWQLAENHPLCQAAFQTYRELFNEAAQIDKWTFSTNGAIIMGEYGIPCIGFGPGKEQEAHAPNEKTFKSHLVKAAAMYAALPSVYARG